MATQVNEMATAETPLAFGSRSAVFASTHGSVLKVPTPDTPPSWIIAESVYCDAVFHAGAPAPQMQGLVRVGETLAIRFARVDGESMWDRVMANLSSAASAGATLAETHVNLRSFPVPITIPELTSRLRAKLHLARELIGEQYNNVRSILDSLASSSQPLVLCHGDLHPKNVLEEVDSRMVLVDWFDAARGPWLADVARTSLLLDLGQGAEGPAPAWLSELHHGYLKVVTSDVQFDARTFARWRVVCAAARLAEGLHIEATFQLFQRELADLGTD